MRVLIAASGGEGHLGPLLPFADSATAAGDEVLVVVPPEQEETVRSGGFACRSTDGVAPELLHAIRAAMASGTAEDRVRFAEVDLFGRACTDAALPAMAQICDTFRPDLILREPCDYASAIVAHRRGVPMAQVAISPGRADWNGLHLASDVIEAHAPGVTAAIVRSPYLSRFPEVDAGFADTRAYSFGVGIGAPRRHDPPLIWITFGTVNTAFAALDGTWRAVLSAIAPLPVRAIASTGRNGAALDAPPNVEVLEWVELADILPEARVVVCHGGSGTTLAALAAGVPLVVIPLLADQPSNAAMVEHAGAGIVIRPHGGGPGLHGLGPGDVSRVQTAIRSVLSEETYARSAERVAELLAERPTVTAVLDGLRAGG